jgi:hypothetical protein
MLNKQANKAVGGCTIPANGHRTTIAQGMAHLYRPRNLLLRAPQVNIHIIHRTCDIPPEHQSSTTGCRLHGESAPKT